MITTAAQSVAEVLAQAEGKHPIYVIAELMGVIAAALDRIDENVQNLAIGLSDQGEGGPVTLRRN